MLYLLNCITKIVQVTWGLQIVSSRAAC